MIWHNLYHHLYRAPSSNPILNAPSISSMESVWLVKVASVVTLISVHLVPCNLQEYRQFHIGTLLRQIVDIFCTMHIYLCLFILYLYFVQEDNGPHWMYCRYVYIFNVVWIWKVQVKPAIAIGTIYNYCIVMYKVILCMV